jgi:hypothetical protein
MPLSDSSQTSMRAVWPEPSPADLQQFPADVSEVSRFSCMKFLGVSGVFDYAGLSRGKERRSFLHLWHKLRSPLLVTAQNTAIFKSQEREASAFCRLSDSCLR